MVIKEKESTQLDGFLKELVDEVRKIKNGQFLGRAYYKFPWRKEIWFVGYFVLCVNQSSELRTPNFLLRTNEAGFSLRILLQNNPTLL